MGKRERFILYLLLGVLVVMAASLLIVKEKKRIARETMVFAYFLDYDAEQQKSSLVPARREVNRSQSTEEKIRFAIEQLLKGLTEREKEEGLTNAVAENAILLNVKVEGDTVYLDFSREIEQGGGTALMTDRLVQIVFTATQFYPVTRVRLLIDGEFIKYFSGEGITDVEHPMSREDFNYLVK